MEMATVDTVGVNTAWLDATQISMAGMAPEMASTGVVSVLLVLSCDFCSLSASIDSERQGYSGMTVSSAALLDASVFEVAVLVKTWLSTATLDALACKVATLISTWLSGEAQSTDGRPYTHGATDTDHEGLALL